VTSTGTLGGTVLPVAGERLFALSHPYELDGRVGTHPLEARGWSAAHCYVFVENERALLLNTGYSAHQEALLAQLDGIVGGRTLSLMIPRPEFISMCNARPVADRFTVDTVWLKGRFDASDLLNFRPEFGPADDGLKAAQTHLLERGVPVPVDPAAGGGLEVISPELRLLPCSWSYDEATRTLFTGDIFGWVTRESRDGPWSVDGTDGDPTTSEDVEQFLVRNRYWWLAGADTEPLRRSLADLFERLEIATIAPDTGCLLLGHAVVDRHYELLDTALARAGRSRSVGVEAGRWRLRAS